MCKTVKIKRDITLNSTRLAKIEYVIKTNSRYEDIVVFKCTCTMKLHCQ